MMPAIPPAIVSKLVQPCDRIAKKASRQIYTMVFCPCCNLRYAAPSGFSNKYNVHRFCDGCISTRGKIAAWVEQQRREELAEVAR